jgi:outer membrane protein TolC
MLPGKLNVPINGNPGRSDRRGRTRIRILHIWRKRGLSAKKKRDASEALLAASEDSYQASLESHRHGLATISDLIGAERDLMTACYTLIQSKADFMISSCALLHATGTASASSTRAH